MSDWFVVKDWLALMLLLPLALGIAAPAWAQGSRPQDPPKKEESAPPRQALIQTLADNPKVKQPEALRKAYAAHDTARLIVNIEPPGAMAGYDSQEERVKAAVDRFLTALSPQTQRAVVRRFKTIYAFVVQATPEQLAEILEQQDVRAVEEDAKVGILSAPSVQ